MLLSVEIYMAWAHKVACRCAFVCAALVVCHLLERCIKAAAAGVTGPPTACMSKEAEICTHHNSQKFLIDFKTHLLFFYINHNLQYKHSTVKN